ncbi:hypothetical protein V1264_000240 [Littorina saxatilis]|uniref:Secreted protein n=1 Tax=Littorina saxatilis TaxID=31220 RepID=A0AAN9GMV3_9CAEN
MGYCSRHCVTASLSKALAGVLCGGLCVQHYRQQYACADTRKTEDDCYQIKSFKVLLLKRLKFRFGFSRRPETETLGSMSLRNDSSI